MQIPGRLRQWRGILDRLHLCLGRDLYNGDDTGYFISSLVVHFAEREWNRLHSSEFSYIGQVLVFQSVQSKENHMRFHYDGPHQFWKEMKEMTTGMGSTCRNSNGLDE